MIARGLFAIVCCKSDVHQYEPDILFKSIEYQLTQSDKFIP